MFMPSRMGVITSTSAIVYNALSSCACVRVRFRCAPKMKTKRDKKKQSTKSKAKQSERSKAKQSEANITPIQLHYSYSPFTWKCPSNLNLSSEIFFLVLLVLVLPLLGVLFFLISSLLQGRIFLSLPHHVRNLFYNPKYRTRSWSLGLGTG